MTAEEQLREHAKTLGISMNALKSLVNQVYVDDENFNKRKLAAAQQQLQSKQITAMDIEMSVNALRLEWERIRLTRWARRRNRWNRIKSFFKPKTKTNEQSKGNPQGR